MILQKKTLNNMIKLGEIYKYYENNEYKIDTVVLLNTIPEYYPNNQENLKENINKFANKGQFYCNKIFED